MKRALSAVSIALLVAASLSAQHAPEPAHEGEHHAAGEDRTTVWKFANFVLLAGGLGYLIAKKGGAFFESRTAEIRRGLEESARLRKEAEGRYAEMDQRLANLATEIENLKNQARQESAAEGERIRRETERDLQKVQAQSEQEIAAAAKAGRQELRTYAAELAVDLAAERIRQRLTPDSDNALVGAMLKDLEQRSNGQAVRVS